MAVRIVVHGIPELIAKLGPDLIAAPARRFLTRWAIKTQTVARESAPVDRGRGRNSIVYQISSSHVPRWAKVGTNLDYMLYQHEGFGPGVFPPPQALEGWARRHGFPPGGGFLVARSIYRKGLEPRPFLRHASEKTAREVPGLVDIMAREIEAEASV